MYEYFDIHSHLYFPDYDKDREELIKEMKKNKIGSIVVATGYESSLKCIELAEKHENLFACIGQHPEELTNDSVFEQKLEKLGQNDKVVAIGECGLDYFRLKDDSQKIIQKTIFEYHIDLALTLDKPLMLHVRPSKGTQDAYLDALAIIEHHQKTSGGKLRGNAHFFAGDMEILKRLIGIGFTVSFTGVITFTTDYNELIKHTPIEMIMSETDAPFVAPVPHRGERNSSLYVPEVVKKIADIKGLSVETVKLAMVSNALRHFSSIAS